MGDVTGVERRCEACEHAGTQGSDHFLRSALMSQDDALYSRPDGTHLLQQCQVFVNNAIGPGNDDPERSSTQALQGVRVPGGILQGNSGGGERIADLAAHLVVTSNNQDPAHSVLRGELNNSRSQLAKFLLILAPGSCRSLHCFDPPNCS